jgi:protein-S-isoprenylcysteine O-methyltransferase Ste14
MKSETCPVPPYLVILVGVIAVSFSAIFIKWSAAPSSIIGMYRLLFTVILMTPFMLGSIREIRH